MGRSLLIAAAVCAAFGCTPARAPSTGTGAAAHADLTCAACHLGGLPVTAANARVRDEACAAGGCHADDGPADVQLANVSFRHRDHARTGPIKATCAGCHTHPADTQDRNLVSTGEACALCHAEALAGRRSEDCRTCHKDPEHVPLTSQGVPIPHSALAASRTGCLRCHYDVAAPTRTVSSRRCASCHGAGTLARGVGENLHPVHAGVACTGCHEGVRHRVLAMSSAVVLECRDCHAAAHGVRTADLGNASGVCTPCHATTHQAQQRLVLGEVPGVSSEPSMKFTAGLTCRSCHAARRTDGGPASEPLRGQAAACAGCHRTEYRQVLAWWMEGTRQREALVGAYLRQAETALRAAAPDSARRLLAWTRSTLALVNAGGGEHNLDLTDSMLRQGLSTVRAAYGLAGVPAPPPPTLGSVPHVGFCSYCHYSLTERWQFERMPSEFHRSVLDTTRINAAAAPAR